MLKTNSIALGIHMVILVLFFMFTSYISYLSKVFAVLQNSYAPFIIFALLSVIAYFFTGFFIGSTCRIRTSGIKNAAAVCVVVIIGLALWTITFLYSNYAGAINSGLEWILFYLFLMPFASLTNLMPTTIVPQYFFLLVCAVPTVLMWAGVEYKAAIYRRTAKR